MGQDEYLHIYSYPFLVLRVEYCVCLVPVGHEVVTLEYPFVKSVVLVEVTTQEEFDSLGLLVSISDSAAHTGLKALLVYFVDLDHGTGTAALYFELQRSEY